MSNDDTDSGPLGNRNPDKRGRGSGSGPNKDVDSQGRPLKGGGGSDKNQKPDKGKSK